MLSSNQNLGKISDRASGWYTLEFSVVALGVVGFILALSDLAMVMQGRSAVRASVEEGLRCVTTTESSDKCRRHVSPSGRITLPPRSDVFASGYEIPSLLPSVRGSWLEEPRLPVPVVNYPPSVLNVEYSMPRVGLGSQQILFPVDARSEYLLEVSPPPFLDGAARSPSVRSLRNRGDTLTPAQTVSLPFWVDGLQGPVQTSTSPDDAYSPQNLIGSVSFTVDALTAGASDALRRATSPGDLPCRQPVAQIPGQPPARDVIVGNQSSPELNWARVSQTDQCAVEYAAYASGARLQPRRLDTNPLLRNGELTVPVALHVRGAAAVLAQGFTAGGATGQVLMEVVWGPTGSMRPIRLGGRVFSSPVRRVTRLGNERHGNQERGLPSYLSDSSAEGSLVFRGVPKENMSSATYAEYPEEVDTHGDPLRIPNGAEVTVRFYLRKISGGSLTAVSWSGDTLRVYYPRFAFVDQRLYTKESDVPTSCAMTAAELAMAGLPHLANAPITRCALNVAAGPIARGASEPFCQDIPENGVPGVETNREAKISEIWSAAVHNPASITGPQQFRFIDRECDPEVRSLQCRQGSVTEFPLCNGLKERLSAPDCAAAVPKPGTLLSMKLGNTPSAGQTGLRLVRACSAEAEVPSCAIDRTAPFSYQPVPRSEAMDRCEFIRRVEATAPLTAQPERITTQRCWQKMDEHRQAAQPVPHFPSFADLTYLCPAETWEFVRKRPEDPTVPYRETAPDDLRPIAIGVSPRQAESICAAEPGRCEIRKGPARSIEVGGGTYRMAESVIDIERAAAVMFDAAQVAYPSAVSCGVISSGDGMASSQRSFACTCSENEHCFSTTITEGSGQNGLVTASASLEVPLVLLSWINSRFSSVSYSASRMYEGKLVK